MSLLVSDEYADLLRAKHEECKWGNAGKSWMPWLEPLLPNYLTVLDYGCGRGSLKPAILEKFPHIQVREYDPGIPGKDALPEPADLVVSTDVLEHIEPELVNNVLQHLADLTLRKMFLSIALKPSTHFLADGRNVHLTLRPRDWWMARLKALRGLKAELVPHGKTLVVALTR